MVDELSELLVVDETTEVLLLLDELRELVEEVKTTTGVCDVDELEELDVVLDVLATNGA